MISVSVTVILITRVMTLSNDNITVDVNGEDGLL